MESKEFLDVQAEAENLASMYSSDARQNSFNALILGESGSGKTYLFKTCRKPVHIDSFDPGGTKSISDEIAKGTIIADTRYECEDPKDPKMFELWMKEMARRAKMKYFNYLGTYILDSSTTWSNAIMNWILKKAHLSGEAPRWAHDYVPQKVQIQNWIAEMLALPCDFILTGHLDSYKDEVTGRVSYRYMTTGKGVITIPLLFDEIYIMEPKATSKGVEYRILTQSNGTYVARSRLAKGGLLDVYEPPDIKAILKKAKMNVEDKPLFTRKQSN